MTNFYQTTQLAVSLQEAFNFLPADAMDEVTMTEGLIVVRFYKSIVTPFVISTLLDKSTIKDEYKVTKSQILRDPDTGLSFVTLTADEVKVNVMWHAHSNPWLMLED